MRRLTCQQSPKSEAAASKQPLNSQIQWLLFTLFSCHFMPLNWKIFGIFPSSPAPPSPWLYFHTNISLSSSCTYEQRVLYYLSFCRILRHKSTISPFLDPLTAFAGPFPSNLPFFAWVSLSHSPARQQGRRCHNKWLNAYQGVEFGAN
jgi:hypothetical protein